MSNNHTPEKASNNATKPEKRSNNKEATPLRQINPQPPPKEVIIRGDLSKSSNLSEFFMEKRCSDVTLILDEGTTRLHAHKIILCARSNFFKMLLFDNPGQSEFSIHGSSEAFRKILKYIYTGSTNILSSDGDLIAPLLKLAKNFSLEDLADLLIKQLDQILTMTNIFTILNDSNLYEMNELRSVCQGFIKKHHEDILRTDCLNVLTQKSMVKLLESNTLVISEIEVFNVAAKWCKNNEDVDNLVMKCVRLSKLNQNEILSIVWPSNLVDNAILLSLLAEMNKPQSKTDPFLKNERLDKNMATKEYGAQVLTGRNTDMLLCDEGTGTDTNSAYHFISEKSGITVDLGMISCFNYIKMTLPALVSSSYYIEISNDLENWVKLIDYSEYYCASHQNLYFEQQLARYIRVVGTGDFEIIKFELKRFEVYFKNNIPKVINQIVRPLENVATPAMGVCLQGSNALLLDANFENREIGAIEIIGSSIWVQLAQPYMLSTMRLLLHHESSYRYLIKTLIDGEDWTIAVDRTDKDYTSWQNLYFDERPVSVIKIIGTHSSKTNNFHCLYFECPSTVPRDS